MDTPRPLPEPQPVPDLATYLTERERALAFSPERRANWERFQASTRREIQPDYMPVRLDIENVSRCNFRCTMCVVSHWPKGRRAEDMPLDDFKRLIDEQSGLVEIKIQGLGEPTIQGDAFFDMIRYARDRAIWVRVITNASLLHLRDNYRKLIDSGVNEVQISFDGATKDVFESIRTGSVFERVRDNCKQVNTYCRERGVDRTKMWTVVQRKNVHQVGELVELGAEMGFRHLVFSLNLHDFGSEEWAAINGPQSVENTFTDDMAWPHIERGRELGIDVYFWRQTSRYSTETTENLCPWPFERAYVSSDLRIVPCCVLGNPQHADLGDARALTEAWNSETWRQFRQAHLDGRIPEVCRGCYHP